MKKLIFALLSFTVVSSYAAPSWRTVQIGSNTTITPTLQDGGINVSSGNIRELSVSNIVSSATIKKGAYIEASNQPLIINDTDSSNQNTQIRFRGNNSALGGITFKSASILCSDVATTCVQGPYFSSEDNAFGERFIIGNDGRVSVGGHSLSTFTVTGSMTIGRFDNTAVASPVDGMSVKGPVVIGTHTVGAGQLMRIFGNGADRVTIDPGGTVTSAAGLVGSSLTISGAGWPTFNPSEADGNEYRMSGTSATVTVGQCAVYSSTNGVTIGATCGGASTGIVQSSAVIVTSSGSYVIRSPDSKSFMSITMENNNAKFRFFESGVGDSFLVWATTGIAASSPIRSNSSILSEGAFRSCPVGSCGSVTSRGMVNLWSPGGTGTYVSFNESGIANRGTFGFAGGSGRLTYKNGAEDITGGTEFFAVSATGGLVPRARTKAQLQVLSPTTAGEMFYCSDCSTDGMVISTGTAVGAFGRISARSTAID